MPAAAEQGAEETPPTLYPQDYLIPDVSMVFDGMTRDEVKTNLINILTVSQYTFGEGYGRRFGIESPDINYSSEFDYTWPDGTFDADACIYSVVVFLDIEDLTTGTHGDMGDVILVVHCADEAMAQMITEVGREIQEEYHLDPGYPQDSDYSLTEDGIYHCIMNLPIIVNE